MRYCLDCETAYADELEACPSCGSDFYTDEPVSQMPQAKVEKGRGSVREPGPEWPLDEAGEPVKPALLETIVSPNSLDADLHIGLLKASGIPTTSRFPRDGSLGQVILGFSGAGLNIYVPETRLEEAKTIVLESEDAKL